MTRKNSKQFFKLVMVSLLIIASSLFSIKVNADEAEAKGTPYVDIVFKINYEDFEDSGNPVTKYLKEGMMDFEISGVYNGNDPIDGVQKGEDIGKYIAPQLIKINTNDINSDKDILGSDQGNEFSDLDVSIFSNIVQYLHSSFGFDFKNQYKDYFRIVDGVNVENYLVVDIDYGNSEDPYIKDYTLIFRELPVPEGVFGGITLDKTVRNITNGETAFSKTTDATFGDVVEYSIRVENGSNTARPVEIKDVLSEYMTIKNSAKDVVVAGSDITISDELDRAEIKTYTYQVQIKDDALKSDIETSALTAKLEYLDRASVDLTDEELDLTIKYGTDEFNGTKVSMQGKDGYMFGGEFYYNSGKITSSARVNILEKDTPISEFTITYTDGTNNESIFKNQVTKAKEGSLTPAFNGKTERDGYTFERWSPEPSKTVTKDVVYVAQWNKVETPVAPTLPATGMSDEYSSFVFMILGSGLIGAKYIFEKKKASK